MTKFEKKIDNILYSLLTTPNIPTGTIVIKKREEVRQAVRELVKKHSGYRYNYHSIIEHPEMRDTILENIGRNDTIDEILKQLGE